MKKPDFGKLPLKTLITILLSSTLAACGGNDGSSRLDDINNGNTGGNGGTGSDGDNLDSSQQGSLGSLIDGAFFEGQIGTGVIVDNAKILPAGRTPFSLVLYDSREGAIINSNAEVTFSSSCLDEGSSLLVNANGETIENNSVVLEAGRTEVFYSANGCSGLDNVSARTTYENSISDTATTSIEILPPRLGTRTQSEFFQGEISTEVGQQVLIPGESTIVEVSLVDHNGNFATGSGLVEFQSQCLNSGLASLTDSTGAPVSGAVETTSGTIELTYTSDGCLNEDKLRATAVYEGVDSGEAEAIITHVPARFGRGESDSFIQGEIGVGIGTATLSAGGTTTLEVTLVDEQGDLISVATDVEFSSSCINRGTSELTQGEMEPTRIFSTESGVLTVDYTAKGCGGTDNITATARVGDNEIGKASATVDIEADSARNIEFSSAEPDLISIKGAGGNESSTLTFQVLGTTGNPLPDVGVAFSLSNEMGGTYLSHTSATSNANGYVSTTVNAGNVPNTVRVTATAGEVATQSSELTISTGIPDQNSFSLAVENLFPIAAWNVDGVETSVTIRLADAFNNPVPDGTAVYFTTSGGAIDSSCLAEDGACTVTWNSQSPRPGFGTAPEFSITEQTDASGDVTGFSFDPCPNGLSECRHGRVRVLATALGNESFIDQDGDALYDENDIFATGATCSRNRPISSAEILSSDVAFIENNSCDDLAEAYLDKNFNGQRDEAEEFVDENQDSGYTTGDGIYNGVLCSEDAEAAGACTKGTVTIRDHSTIVMTCDTPYRMPNRGTLPGQRDVDLVTGQSDSVTMLLADCNGNGMPEGTEVSLDLSGANNVTATVSPEAPLGASGEPTIISVNIEADDTEAASGTIRVVISSPSAEGIKESFETIRVNP